MINVDLLIAGMFINYVEHRIMLIDSLVDLGEE